MAAEISTNQLGLTSRTLGYFPPAFSGSPRAEKTAAEQINPGAGATADTANFSQEAQVAARGGEAAEKKNAAAEAGSDKKFDEQEQKEVQKLQQRDREVRQHEQAHVAAAGRYARGGAQLEFTRGPDGRQYATGGEASIDVSPESTPAATIAKAEIVRRAALAPAEPSSQDRQVAAQASQLELEARRQLAEQRQNESHGAKGNASAGAAGNPYEQNTAAAEPPRLDLKA